MNKLIIILLGMFLVFCFSTYSIASDYDDVKMEADYILSTQYIDDSSNPTYGAFNNVYGDPTWVVPGENAVAIMGLVQAANYLGNDFYRQRANMNADYLVSVQDAADGAWYDQYNYDVPVSGAGKSLRHTAEILIAFDKLGFDSARYESMKKGAQFILANQDVANKGGVDDGLVGGGKDASGNYHTWRWSSDNSFAYQALEATAQWAEQKGDTVFAQELKTASARILQGIDTVLLDSTSNDHWVRAVDQNGDVVVSEDRNDWISYAPFMLDVPFSAIDPNDVGLWISQILQETDGSLIWDDVLYPDRKSPGYSFQAVLAWANTGQLTYAQEALSWAENSTLWQKSPDGNGITGGWIDWIEPSQQAPQWQRFIDTSAYYIMAKTGGYDFQSQAVPEPSTLALLASGLLGSLIIPRRKN